MSVLVFVLATAFVVLLGIAVAAGRHLGGRRADKAADGVSSTSFLIGSSGSESSCSPDFDGGGCDGGGGGD